MTGISPALGEPRVHEPLAGLVMGDAAVAAPREHGWPGKLFIAFSYVMAAASAVSVVVIGLSVAANVGLAAAFWKRALTAVVWAALQWRVAGEVRRFSRWGWYGAMAELAAAAAAKVWVMAQGNVVGGAIGLCIDLAWLRYFWERRDQFDVDVSL